MTTVHISEKGKKFLKKKYSAKVAAVLVSNSSELRNNGSVQVKIGGRDFIVKSSRSTTP